jgi:hypothetical protein
MKEAGGCGWFTTPTGITIWAEAGVVVAAISATPIRGMIAVKILVLLQLSCRRVFIALFQKLNCEVNKSLNYIDASVDVAHTK